MAKVLTVGRANSGRRRDEIDELLLRIKGLVYVRAILEDEAWMLPCSRRTAVSSSGCASGWRMPSSTTVSTPLRDVFVTAVTRPV